MRAKYLMGITFFIAFIQVTWSQIDANKQGILTIYDEDGFVNSDEQGLFHYLISIKSRDTIFERDGYNFIINNRTGIEEYANLSEMGETVSIDTLDYLKISDLAHFSNCELHDFLSLKKEINVIFKNKKNSFYWKYPIIYTGTQKNVEMMKM